MRRLVVEVSSKGLTKLQKERKFEKIKTLEILRFLRNDPAEVDFICSVEFKDKLVKIEDFFPKNTEIQLIEQEKSGPCIYLIKNKSRGKHSHLLAPDDAHRGYIPTFEIGNGKAKISFLGNELQVKNFLEALQKRHVRFRVVSLTDAKFSPESPLNCLTEKQRRSIVLAFELGYFDTPRKITSEELAKKLNLVKSTLTVQLHRAERRLLAEMLNQ